MMPTINMMKNEVGLESSKNQIPPIKHTVKGIQIIINRYLSGGLYNSRSSINP